MKKRDLRQEKPQTLKKRLMAALAMLLVSTTMMSTTTFAWFVLSTAPEVTGIETQVGANGSLEIVLLNTETRANMSTIRAGLGGGSLQENQITANNVWGNLIDLGYTEYGLGELTLLPARLDATANGESYSVDLNKLLAVPNYGYDGRIIELTRDTASAIYQETGFLYSGAQDYGVRAIGTSDALSPQGSALSSAKTNISTWTKSAKSGAQAALTNNIEGLFEIILVHAGALGTQDKFDDIHKATMESMLTDLEAVLNYLDNSLRQGLVAYVASEIGEEDLFVAARDRILDTATPLSELLDEVAEVPEEFAGWVEQLATMQNKRNLAVAACAALTDNDYTWDEIKGVLANIMNMDQLLINGDTISKLDVNGLMTAALIEMTLAPGSGLFADIADFTDNYTISATYMSKAVEMSTASAVKPAYLVALSAVVNALEPADGGENASALPLTATYGYAIDLAFRCNAAEPDLVLQTKGVQRVYSGSEDGEGVVSDSASTQGGGSYMEFSSKDDNFTLEQRLALMDAIRVGFVDDQGAILGIAKLNVTSREVVEEGVVKAPLYLYDYAFEADELTGGLILTMGERKLTDNLITKLEQNVAKAVTAVVWLDGDIVDNTMVSATEATSLDGVLNLQFATSAELIPALDNTVLSYTADKAGLEEAMIAANEIVAAGQGTYTNVSWNEFMTAYRRAEDVNDNLNASHIEIRNAVDGLSKAIPQLVNVSNEALMAKADEIRADIMGENSTEIGAYVLDMGKGGYVAVNEYTEDDLAGWGLEGSAKKGTINSVEHEKNKNDEGNGVYTTVYTDATWNALAAALYQAEAVAMNAKATDDQINSALTALTEAEKALEHAVYYIPYEYNGALYYMAKSEIDAEDTYGRWYDSNFKRIFADVTILKLDAYATKATIAQMGQAAYISNAEDKQEYITPDIAFLSEVFPELRDAEVKGVHWDAIDPEFFTEMMNGSHYNRLSVLLNTLASDDFKDFDTSAADTAKAAAEEVKTAYETYTGEGATVAEPTALQAEDAIKNLNDAIVELYKELAKADASPMTDNQRLMLTTAVNSAKAVEGYEENAELKKAAEDAEAMLAEGAETTNKDAADALAALNALLEKDVTEGNTIVHKLPGFDSDELVYEADFPGIKLNLTDKTGTTTLGATILTKDGVVVSVSKTIGICNEAKGVEIQKIKEGSENGEEITTLTLKVGDKVNVKAVLDYELAEGETLEGKGIVAEPVDKYTWASENKACATVSGGESAVIEGAAKGTTTIKLAVTTVCGNPYTVDLAVTVTE